jgi:hypothetical protein
MRIYDTVIIGPHGAVSIPIKANSPEEALDIADEIIDDLIVIEQLRQSH